MEHKHTPPNMGHTHFNMKHKDIRSQSANKNENENGVTQDFLNQTKRTNKIKKNMTSYEAYLHCRDAKDRKSMRKLITDSHHAYLYCSNVKDRKSMRKLITNSYDAYLYCLYVKDRKSMRKLITDDALIDELNDIKLGKKDK